MSQKGTGLKAMGPFRLSIVCPTCHCPKQTAQLSLRCLRRSRILTAGDSELKP